jgi:hypothetical protein
MDWKMFFGGIIMLGMALMFWSFNRWSYKNNDDYDRMKRISNWFGVVIWSLGGLLVIFISMVAKK